MTFLIQMMIYGSKGKLYCKFGWLFSHVLLLYSQAPSDTVAIWCVNFSRGSLLLSIPFIHKRMLHLVACMLAEAFIRSAAVQSGPLRFVSGYALWMLISWESAGGFSPLRPLPRRLMSIVLTVGEWDSQNQWKADALPATVWVLCRH